MGFFSWNCAECGESISNMFSNRPEDSECVLVTPDKNIHDPMYEGYGKFNGVDVFELIGDGNVTRAIDIYCTGDPNDLLFRIKVVHKRCHHSGKGYDDYYVSEDCEFQGYFYD